MTGRLLRGGDQSHIGRIEAAGGTARTASSVCHRGSARGRRAGLPGLPPFAISPHLSRNDTRAGTAEPARHVRHGFARQAPAA